MFSDSEKQKVFKKFGDSKIKRIRAFILAGLPGRDLQKYFKLTDIETSMFYLEHGAMTIIEENRCSGHKNSSYYEGDFPPKPVYKLEDLEAEEKMISKKDTSTKLWTWEE
jgi:hypothetical protein